MYLCIYIATNLQLQDTLRGLHRASLEMQLVTEIEWTQKYTPRPWSSKFGYALGWRHWVNWERQLEAMTIEFGDALGRQDRVNWKLYLEAEMERVWRCTGWPWSSEFGDALGGRERVKWELHLEAVIDRVWRCTLSPRSSEFGDALGGRNRVNWELHLEDVLDRVWRCTFSKLWSSEIGWVPGGGWSVGGPREARQVLRHNSSVS